MWHRRAILLGLLASGLSACASKFKTYRGLEVTRIVAQKSQRRLYLLHHDKVLRAYNMGLGHTPQGHKQFEGDGKTPEGVYMIDRRNPNSAFHLSLGISYPNRNDWEYAHAQGKNPGGDIFIHGENGQNPHKIRDWTVGCIAVTDREIEEIYAMVRDGTQIHIVA